MHRKSEYRHARELDVEVLDELETIFSGDGDIHQREIGLFPRRKLQRRKRVTGLGADFHVRLLGNHST